MRGLDAWITGNWGDDHPDNQLCPECGRDGDHHCEKCGCCEAEGTCWECDHTCDYCDEVVDHIILHPWSHGRYSGVDRLCRRCAKARAFGGAA